MKGLHHVGITVADLETAIDFYHGVLGLEFVNEPSPLFDDPELGPAVGVPGAALRQVSLALGDTILELLQYTAPPSPVDAPLPQNALGAQHVAFLVADAAATKAELEAKGVRFLSDVNVVDDGRARRVAVGVLLRPGGQRAGAGPGRLHATGGAAGRHRRLPRAARQPEASPYEIRSDLQLPGPRGVADRAPGGVRVGAGLRGRGRGAGLSSGSTSPSTTSPPTATCPPCCAAVGDGGAHRAHPPLDGDAHPHAALAAADRRGGGGRSTSSAAAGSPSASPRAIARSSSRRCRSTTRTRGKRFVESLELLRLAWTGEPFTFTGEIFQLPEVVVRPKPIQRPGIPLWLGGTTEVAMRRVVRHGAPVFPGATDEIGVVAKRMASYDRLRDELGPPADRTVRSARTRPAAPGRRGRHHRGGAAASAPRHPGDARDLPVVGPARRLHARCCATGTLLDDLVIVGDADHCRGCVERYAQLGLTDLLLQFAMPAVDPGIIAESQARFMAEVATPSAEVHV